MNVLSAFDAIQNNQIARQFSTQKIPDQLLYQLIELANLAPSGFNLQPWHFILVRDTELKQILYHIALNQEQILEAPCTLVFVGDLLAWKNSYEKIIHHSLDAHNITKESATLYQKNIRLFFNQGPFGLFGLAKRILVPLKRLRQPVPNVISSDQEATAYIRSQVMLAASTFMIAASSVGLATLPLENFDEHRIKKLLAIPKKMTVPLIMPIGYPLEPVETQNSYRLPLLEKLSIDLFPNKLEKAKSKS